MKKLVLMAAVALIALMGNTRAEACLVNDPSGTLNVRSSPNGLVVGALKNGTLVVIEERRGDWVSITPHAKRSEKPVWVQYTRLDCDFIDDEYRKAERLARLPSNSQMTYCDRPSRFVAQTSSFAPPPSRRPAPSRWTSGARYH